MNRKEHSCRKWGQNDSAGPSRFIHTYVAQAKRECKQRVRQRSYDLHLPVVATGFIPRIYRRACFTHRATPQ